MIIKNEVKIHPESVNYLKRTLGQYEEVDSIRTVENPIIHLYPKEDTYDENGELNGFIDALFFEANIYDTKKMTVWKSNSYHDGIIPYADLKISQIKTFKDLSTMIALSGTYTVSTGTAISIGRVN